MLFFKRILNFTPDAIAQREKRRATRYPIGQAFPVKAVLNITGRDGEGFIIKANARSGQDWGGWMLNLSSTGASMQLHPAALTARGEACRFMLTFENNKLVIGGQVAHFRAYPNYSVCGISLDFPDTETQKAYLQLLEPVMIGASFKPVDSKRVKQDTPDLKKEQYRGDSDSQLTVWRAAEGNVIWGFDLRVGPYGVAGTSESPELEVTATAGAKEGPKLNAGSQGEVRDLFHWIVPNLSKSVPADVRKFLARF